MSKLGGHHLVWSRFCIKNDIEGEDRWSSVVIHWVWNAPLQNCHVCACLFLSDPFLWKRQNQCRLQSWLRGAQASSTRSCDHGFRASKGAWALPGHQPLLICQASCSISKTRVREARGRSARRLTHCSQLLPTPLSHLLAWESAALVQVIQKSTCYSLVNLRV